MRAPKKPNPKGRRFERRVIQGTWVICDPYRQHRPTIYLAAADAMRRYN